MPSLLTSLSSLISGDVGNGLANAESDIQNVASSLKKLKYYDQNDDVMMTRSLDGAIQNFQKDNGLKVDGVLRPGGETERQIQGLLSPLSHHNGLAKLQSGVGRGQANREDDVREVETGLGLMSYLPAVHKIQPRGFMTSGIESGMRKFQADKNLKQDGIALPGGETWSALSQLISATPASQKGQTQKNKYLSSVPDEAIRAFLTGSEFDVSHFYKDTTDNVTIGIGKMIPKDYPLDKIQFHLLNKKREPLRPAKPHEVLAEFKRVQGMTKGLDWPRYSIGKDRDYIGIAEEESQRILDEEIQTSTRELRIKFKEFDQYPPSVQQALLDMQFNMGNTRFSSQKWPSFYNAVNRKDWRRAAKESHRMQVGDKRNQEIYDLLEKAEN